MDIKVKEYIRTRFNGIRKVYEVRENAPINRYKVKANGVDKDGDEYYTIIRVDEVLNHSFNILDLIEIGDIGVLDCYAFKVKKVLSEEDILELKAKNYELLEILTKEQFERGKYVVGG